MKTFILYVIACFLTLVAVTQDARIDSLRYLLKVEEQDTVKMQLLLGLAEEHSVSDTALASKYYHDAVLISKSIDNVTYITTARKKSSYLRKTRRKEQAIAFLNQVLAETSDPEIPELEMLYTGIGIAHYQSYQPDSAAHYFRKGILLARKYSKTEREGILLMNIGNTNYMKGLLDSAVFYYARSQEVLAKTTSYHRLAQLHITKTIIYQNLKDYNRAESELNSALKLQMPNQKELVKHRSQVFEMKSRLHLLKNEYPSALANIDSALLLYESRKEGEEVMKSLRLKSSILLKQGNVSAAQDILWQLYDYQKENADLYERVSVLNDIGSSFTISGNHREAIKLFRQGLKLADSLGVEKTKRGLLKNLGGTYLTIANYDSAKWFLDRVIQEPEGNKQELDTYGYLAKYHIKVNQPDSALLYVDYLLAAEKVKEIPSLYFDARLLQASAYYSKGRFNQALEIIDEIISQKNEINSLNIIRDSYQLLYQILSGQRRYKDALAALENYQVLNDSVINLDNLTQGIRLQFQSAYERQQLSDSLQYAEKEQLALLEQQKSDAMLSNQRITIISIGSVTLLLLAISLILYRNNRSSKKKNELIGIQKDHIQRSLSDKEILLKEIHHRVKNNLQVISSLLNLQAGSLSDEAAIGAVKDGQHRVKSMALIHQKLYQDDDLRGVAVQDYVESLTSELMSTFGMNHEDVQIEVDTEQLKLDIDTLIPLGLIINELITNSMKYAFRQSEKGLLKIKMSEDNDKLAVSVSDNGEGMDESALTSSNSFGWKMIRSLARKLKAEISIENNAGTEVQLIISRYKLAV